MPAGRTCNINLSAQTLADDDFLEFVVDEVFVLSNSAKIAGSLAGYGTKAVPGAKGALVLNMNAEQIAKEALKLFTKQGLAIHTGVQITKVTVGSKDVNVAYTDAAGTPASTPPVVAKRD